ncbi:MAG: beta-ketoacyl synthase chain length factor [Thiobacillus sp.]|uniref:beta-ketoacyl synthase chain length factor n=1 Tax=Thiobacillus sp. TaxID=924 RepID=UPI0027360000|nr:beta-ketoacyl synthase chain length factor [Thiobacillus sp.]MDP3585904.1 beta-ketoacyl synthase chain length factor [Thiobacillus sp.]
MSQDVKLAAYLDGIGLVGPGLDNWLAARPILAGAVPYESRPLAVAAPQSLPPAERRRTGVAIKVALAVGQEACANGQLDARQLAAVFSSSGADNDNCDAICKVLASDDRSISPTRFHNSVHNAPAGYWGIASGAMTPATVLCAHDGSFGAGLLEAMTQVAIDRCGTLLIAYDMPYPEPLHAKRPLPAAFGIALALMPERSAHSLARIELSLVDAESAALAEPELEALRRAIPAARGLPLLQAIACGAGGRVVLDYLAPLSLAVEIELCR